MKLIEGGKKTAGLLFFLSQKSLFDSWDSPHKGDFDVCVKGREEGPFSVERRRNLVTGSDRRRKALSEEKEERRRRLLHMLSFR